MPITVKDILIKIRPVKPCSKRQVFRYLDKANVKPLGVRTRPRLYPDRAPKAILDYLGIGELPSMSQLRDIKRRSTKAQGREL
jgi:hypothetical protein